MAYRPTAPIASYVEQFWYCEGYQMAHRRERVLPNGRFQLIIDLSDSFVSEGEWLPTGQSRISPPPLIVGMQSRYTVIDTAALQSIVGVLFWPGGARAFFDPPADEFHNQHIPLDLVWGPAAGDLRDRLREGATPAKKFAVLEATLGARAKERGGRTVCHRRDPAGAAHPQCTGTHARCWSESPSLRPVVPRAGRGYAETLLSTPSISGYRVPDQFRCASRLGGCSSGWRVLRPGASGT